MLTKHFENVLSVPLVAGDSYAKELGVWELVSEQLNQQNSQCNPPKKRRSSLATFRHWQSISSVYRGRHSDSHAGTSLRVDVAPPPPGHREAARTVSASAFASSARASVDAEFMEFESEEVCRSVQPAFPTADASTTAAVNKPSASLLQVQVQQVSSARTSASATA